MDPSGQTDFTVACTWKAIAVVRECLGRGEHSEGLLVGASIHEFKA